VDGVAGHGTGYDRVDENPHLAKVRVAGSNPVFRSRTRLGARHGYSGAVDAQPVMTAEELIERVRHAAPPTSDDVTILWDGRRLDSRESVMEWLAEVQVKRAEEAAADANAEP
jgi:hypothetical protein